jgi:hypothetical protein
MVRYRVKADRARENEEAIVAVFEALEREAPSGIRYASFKLGDGVSFVHIARVETNDGNNPLLALEAFKRFTRDIEDRCEERPVTSEAALVGSYRMLALGN